MAGMGEGATARSDGRITNEESYKLRVKLHDERARSSAKTHEVAEGPESIADATPVRLHAPCLRQNGTYTYYYMRPFPRIALTYHTACALRHTTNTVVFKPTRFCATADANALAPLGARREQ